MIRREVKECRICRGRNLMPYLDLGKMPLVNSYLSSPAQFSEEPRFPLVILLCQDCGLSQLSLVISPEVLFRDYDYHSSVSQTFQRHCSELAKETTQKFGLTASDLVVEIASNDGCLLSKFKEAGASVCGVEPARNLAKIAEDRGLPTVAEFWDQAISDQILSSRGRANIIVCTNVLAHVDDLHGFIAAVRSLLKPEGAFIFEVPSMLQFLRRRAFDTTYHEHLSYFLVTPLKRVLEMNGFQIQDVEDFDIHGGSIRVTALLQSSTSRPASLRVGAALDLEKHLGLLKPNVYLDFQSQVSTIKEELQIFFSGIRSRGYQAAAYGASAKGTILLNYCELDSSALQFIIDDTPAKQGKYSPGVHLPIVPRRTLTESNIQYLLLLAWNFAKELITNTPDFSRSGGRYVIPIPSLQVIAPSKLGQNRSHEETNHISASI